MERVLSEQQTWQGKQLAAMRQRERDALEALRKREHAFEATLYEHRQKMLREIEIITEPKNGREGCLVM